jgi:hypothetical protein
MMGIYNSILRTKKLRLGEVKELQRGQEYPKTPFF